MRRPLSTYRPRPTTKHLFHNNYLFSQKVAVDPDAGGIITGQGKSSPLDHGLQFRGPSKGGRRGQACEFLTGIVFTSLVGSNQGATEDPSSRGAR
ncbi:hypothetical protein TNCV_1105231 [Trichonephila clavipes]|nr:hypothetical protein TNCV_1105231 [Trichonephila clavipes]